MNIALVLPYFSDRFGGPVAAARGTGGALAAIGHDVSYWATVAKEDGYVCTAVPGVHVYRVTWPRAWRRSKGLREGLWHTIQQTHILQIQSVWLYPSYAAGRIACGKGVPYVICPAGTLQPWAIGDGRLKRLKKAAYLRLIGGPLMEKAACVQAASIQEAEQVHRLGHTGPVTVIPNGVDINALDDSDSSQAEMYWPLLKDRLVVLFMSRLSPEKGLDSLISVWAELTRLGHCRDAVLVIAGPDFRGYEGKVKAMIERYGVGPGVLMTGMVQGGKKSALLKRADVFVLPSYSENFGIVVAEALACGTPVITTTGTPWQQLHAVDAGRWVPPTKEAIGQALRELLRMSDSQRRQMGERGAALVHEHYTWGQVARKFLTVCDCILAGKSIPLHPEPKELRKA